MSLKKICVSCFLRPLKSQDYKKFVASSGENFSIDEFVSFVNVKEFDFFRGIQGVFFLFDSERSYDIVGFSEINFLPSSNDVVIGYEIFPKFRRMGYGEKLLKLTVEMCEELDANKVFAKVAEHNDISQKILMREGFSKSEFFPLCSNEPNCFYYLLELGECHERINK